MMLCSVLIGVINHGYSKRITDKTGLFIIIALANRWVMVMVPPFMEVTNTLTEKIRTNMFDMVCN